jgi:hypothetical protein
MSVFPRLHVLLTACLLGLLTVSCQRANYSFQGANDDALVTSIPVDSTALVKVSMPPSVTSAEVATTLISPISHRQFARSATSRPLSTRIPSRLPAWQTIRVKRQSYPRVASKTDRSSALSEDTKFTILLLSGALLLIGGGVVLAFGVGGALAVTGGVVLMLAGLCLGLFCLYVSLLGHQSMH